MYDVHAQLYQILCDPTDYNAADHCPLCMEFSRREYWSGLPFPSPRDHPNPGIEPTSPVFLALAGDSSPQRHLGSHITNTKAKFTYKQNKIGKIKTKKLAK